VAAGEGRPQVRHTGSLARASVLVAPGGGSWKDSVLLLASCCIHDAYTPRAACGRVRTLLAKLRLGSAHGFTAYQYIRDLLERVELLKFHAGSSGGGPFSAGTPLQPWPAWARFLVVRGDISRESPAAFSTVHS
jgi:hypothetical protein